MEEEEELLSFILKDYRIVQVRILTPGSLTVLREDTREDHGRLRGGRGDAKLNI